MNWIFGKNQNHQMVASTPLQQQRIKQIKSLHTCNSNVIEETRDFEYKIPFSCGKTSCVLHVSLPSQFPRDKPVISVLPPMKHPWVDENMKVMGSTELNLFQMHSDLGKVVQNIIKEFKKNKPQFNFVTSSYQPSSYQLSSASLAVTVGNLISTSDDITESTMSQNNIYSDEIVQPGRLNRSTEIDIIMGKLKNLGRKELEEICLNPDLLLDYVHEMESVVDFQNQRKELVEQNESIAKSNLSTEPIIEDLKVELKETFEQYIDIYNSLDEKIRKQDELRQDFDISNILTNLRIGILQAEEESEVIAENFLKSSVNLDEFLGTFLEKRKTCHLRRMKEVRFKNIITY